MKKEYMLQNAILESDSFKCLSQEEQSDLLNKCESIESIIKTDKKDLHIIDKGSQPKPKFMEIKFRQSTILTMALLYQNHLEVNKTKNTNIMNPKDNLSDEKKLIVFKTSTGIEFSKLELINDINSHLKETNEHFIDSLENREIKLTNILSDLLNDTFFQSIEDAAKEDSQFVKPFGLFKKDGQRFHDVFLHEEITNMDFQKPNSFELLLRKRYPNFMLFCYKFIEKYGKNSIVNHASDIEYEILSKASDCFSAWGFGEVYDKEVFLEYVDSDILINELSEGLGTHFPKIPLKVLEKVFIVKFHYSYY